MGIRKSFAIAALVLVVPVAAFVIPSPALARAGDDKPRASKPRPDLATKVYTDDDLRGWRSVTPATAGETQPGQISARVYVPGSTPTNPSSAGLLAASSLAARSVNPEQDPQWYGRQLAQLESELAAVENREAQLQDFRASGSTQTQPTGLALNAPCEGITTDNLIAELERRRQELTRQMNGLDDVAQANGLPPGVIAQALAAGQAQPSPEQQRAQSVARYRQLTGELAETQAVAADMQQQAASQGITLTPPTPGQGGNMTTDLLSRLAARSDNLQNEAASVEADARGLGVQPGDLR